MWGSVPEIQVSRDPARNTPIRQAMLVDDNETFLRHLSRFVERVCGLEVVETCSSVEEALEKVGMQRPDIIFLDISMKGMSGLEGIALLKPLSPGSVIVIVSSMPAEYAQKARELGADGYVEKDRIAEDLPALISSLK